MIKIGNTIIEPGIKEVDQIKTRTTVRGVLIKDDLVYMLYSKLYNDYTFPGGGVKEDEDLVETLKRELYEEIGAKEVSVSDHLGYTEELRYGISGSNSIYKQTSHYYLCDVTSFGKPNYVGRELEQGLEAKWVNIDEVIKHNELVTKEERTNSKGYQTVLVRENTVLNYIKESLL
ncbi:MAG TPA: NUDIX domain-containing protein [Haploplasma sp.]|nr:NUDIX domain-containing protein [Haploplasma sp.]